MAILATFFMGGTTNQAHFWDDILGDLPVSSAQKMVPSSSMLGSRKSHGQIYGRGISTTW